MASARLPARFLALALIVGLTSCQSSRRESPEGSPTAQVQAPDPQPAASGPAAGTAAPHTYTDDELKKYVQYTAEVLDCLSVTPRACGHVYPTEGGIELCNVTTIDQRKADGTLLGGPTVGWNGAGRHMGVFVGIKVVGDPVRNSEAHYIYHIGMNVYPTNLAPDLIAALRGYCTGQPNVIPGNDTYADCRCVSGAGGARQEICNNYQNGRIVGPPQAGSGGLCRQ